MHDGPMVNSPATGLLAIDVGNSRVKLGWYAPRDVCFTPAPMALSSMKPAPAKSSSPHSIGLPMPDDRLELESRTLEHPLAGVLLTKWLDSLPLSSTRCLIASVQRAKLGQLLDLLASYPAADRLLPPEVLRHDKLPIVVRTDQPEQVGIDRLLNGVSANYLRQPQRPAIIVDMGSAITVDRVEMDGAFVGGAILPGLALSACALHMGTDLLPQILPAATEPQPAVVGKNTTASMAAGLYWGAIGAVREMVRQHRVEGDSPCEWFLTGGDALRVADELLSHDRAARYQAQMVLAGIWLVAQE